MTLHVTGMTCAGCASSVEKALSKVSGVESASVNLTTESARIEFSNGRASRESLVKAVNNVGYGVADDDRSVQLKISGMTCAGCASTIQEALNTLDGVSDASVNFATNRARVSFDPDTLSTGDLTAAVSGAGYSAEVISEDSAHTSDKDTDEELRDARRRMWIAWGLTAPVMVLMFFHMTGLWMPPYYEWFELVLAIPVLAIAGGATFAKGWKTSVHLAPNMDALIALGTGAAFLTAPLAIAGFPIESYGAVAAMIMAFHLTGRYLEAGARGRASQAIRELLELGAKTARVERDGETVEIPVDEIQPDDIMHIRPGEKIPTDGVIEEGHSAIDESMATGESIPAEKGPGSEVIGATLNTTGTLAVRATRVGKDTFLNQVIAIVEEAQATKVPIQALADRITGVFVPIILLVALGTFLAWMFLPGPMGAMSGVLSPYLPWVEIEGVSALTLAMFSAVAVLVIACPCAMGLATPTAIMVGTGVGASRGILIRSGEAIQSMRDIKAIALDKTGTITEGKPQVTDVHPHDCDEERLLRVAASADSGSEHPIAQAVVRHAQEQSIELEKPAEFEAVAGKGIRATLGGKTVYVGSPRLIRDEGADLGPVMDVIDEFESNGKSAIGVSEDGTLLGIIAVADTIKDDSAEAIRALKKLGLEVVMLTGDNERTARAVAKQAGIDTVRAEILPQDKSDAIDELKREYGKVAMIGDGINDAAALAQADIGIAIGTGTDVAIESSDVTLVKGSLSDAVTAIELSEATFRKIVQNLIWAFGYNVLAIPLAMLALLHPLIAEAAMALSSINVVTNSLRLRKFSAK